MARVYIRRRAARRALFRRHARYQLLRPDGPPIEMWLCDLDRLLDRRRFPADFWAAVHEDDRAFGEGDSSSIEFPTGHLVRESD